MRVFLLIVGASILPLVWGWAVHRFLGWLWPEPDGGSAAPGEPPGSGSAPTPFEYQI